MEHEEIRKAVLDKIKPKMLEIQASRNLANRIIGQLNDEDYEARMVGSRARGTFISGERDIDIFFFMPKTISREELEKKAVEIGKKILRKYKPTTHYAEHPYVKANVDGTDVEIVPCYKIQNNESIISSVDRTPLHNEYLMKKLTEKQKEDVILLKQFLKASSLYGADQKTKGFSGYLCELLTLEYGSFEKLLEAASKWNIRIIIDIEKHKPDYEKFKDTLVVIDPVDRNRNVASAVSRETLSYFIIKARDYLRKPELEYFFPKPKKINIKSLVKGRRMVIISFRAPDVIPEILWSQLESLAKKIKEELYSNEFETYRVDYWTDEKEKCEIVLEINTYDLGKYKRHKGPEIWDSEHSESFIAKNPLWWMQRSVIEAWKERKFTTAEEVVKNTLQTMELIPSHLQAVVWSNKIVRADKAHKHEELMKKYFSAL